MKKGSAIYGDLILFPKPDKVFFKTSLTTRFWLKPTHFCKIFFEWCHEIMDIFSYKYLQYEISSFFQKYFCNFEDCKIEFY